MGARGGTRVEVPGWRYPEREEERRGEGPVVGGGEVRYPARKRRTRTRCKWAALEYDRRVG